MTHARSLPSSPRWRQAPFDRLARITRGGVPLANGHIERDLTAPNNHYLTPKIYSKERPGVSMQLARAVRVVADRTRYADLAIARVVPDDSYQPPFLLLSRLAMGPDEPAEALRLITAGDRAEIRSPRMTVEIAALGDLAQRLSLRHSGEGGVVMVRAESPVLEHNRWVPPDHWAPPFPAVARLMRESMGQ